MSKLAAQVTRAHESGYSLVQYQVVPELKLITVLFQRGSDDAEPPKADTNNLTDEF